MSTRAGCFKLLEPMGEAKVLDRVLANVRASSVDGVVAVLGFEANRVLEQVSFGRVEVAVNEKFSEGMSTSLRLGLEQVDGRADAALIVLGDQPFVTAREMNLLIEAFNASPRRIVVPVYQGKRGNPVLLSLDFLDEVNALTGDVGAKSIIAAHPDEVLEVYVNSPSILHDVDTADDLRRLRVQS